MKRLLFTLTLCLLPVSASADIVTMNDGRVLKGKVEAEGQDLIIKGQYGSLRVKKANVKDWQLASPAEKAFAKKKALLGNGNADARYRLGVYARDKGLASQAKTSFESVLLISPDHPGARSALGYVKHQGIWMTIADKARSEGKVRYRGSWVTLNEKAVFLKKAREKKERLEKEKIEKNARKRLRRNLLRKKGRESSSRSSTRSRRPIPTFNSGNRYRLLQNYYGPYYPRPSSGYRSVSGAYGIPGFLGPRRFPLYRGLGLGPGLTYQQQLLAAAALRQGRKLPRHLTQPLRVIQSPGFGGPRRNFRGYNPRFRQSGLSVGGQRSFSGGRGRVRFNVGARSSTGRSSFGNTGFRGSYLRRNVGSSFSGSYKSRSGRSRVQFRFTP